MSNAEYRGEYGTDEGFPMVMPKDRAIKILDAVMGDNWADITFTKDEIREAVYALRGRISILPGRYGRFIVDYLSVA